MVKYAHKKQLPLHEPWRERFANFYKDMGDPPPGSYKFRLDKTRKGFVPGNVHWWG